MGQGNLFGDLGGGLRDEGMERAFHNAPEEWKEAAFDALASLAREQEFLTSEDILDMVGLPPEPRAIGPVMCNSSLIRNTGRITTARRPSRHKGLLHIWRSIIFSESA